MITPGETWPVAGSAEQAVAILWSAGNGSGTASASATVTASSCAECLVGDGNLPSALHLLPLHAVLLQEPSWERGRDAGARVFLYGDGLCRHPVVLGNLFCCVSLMDHLSLICS